MVLKIQGKVPFALDESRDNKKWHQQVASEWKMKHTRIKKRKEKKSNKK